MSAYSILQHPSGQHIVSAYSNIQDSQLCPLTTIQDGLICPLTASFRPVYAVSAYSIIQNSLCCLLTASFRIAYGVQNHSGYSMVPLIDTFWIACGVRLQYHSGYHIVSAYSIIQDSLWCPLTVSFRIVYRVRL